MLPDEILVRLAPLGNFRPRACGENGRYPSEIRVKNASADEARIGMAEIHEHRSSARSSRLVEFLIDKPSRRHLCMRSDVASYNIMIVAGSVREKLH